MHNLLISVLHIPLGFVSVPFMCYFFMWLGRGFLSLCNLLVSTYNFLVNGIFTSAFNAELSYTSGMLYAKDFMRDMILFPETPLIGVNLIGRFLQYSFFDYATAWSVVLWSAGVVFIWLTITTVSDFFIDKPDFEDVFIDKPEFKSEIKMPLGYYAGVLLSLLCFYPAFLMVMFIPIENFFSAF